MRSRWSARALSVGVGALVLSGVVVPPALADTAPVDPSLPATVSSDPLPTVQIDGVVWNQLIVGNTVYVGGEFTSARPAGAAAGTDEVPRSNLLAYDLTTGELITSFAPVVDAQVKDLALSPDGTTLYIAGSFTSIDGQSRYRAAAFDVATGALTSWRPVVNSRVNAIDATATTVVIGGIFTAVGSETHVGVAAVDTATGAPLPFAASADDHAVLGLAIAPDEASVVIAGNFTSVNGSSDPGYGLARLDLTTGANLALPVDSVIRDAGDNSAVLSLEADDTSFYGTGYHFARAGNSEGVFAASWATGELTWLEDCHGDTYSAYPVGDVVYAASHKHYCGNSGSFPQTTPWTYHHATAMTNAAMGVNTSDYLGYPDHPGTPSPAILAWWPRWTPGTYTGVGQGPWTVTGNADYVLYGGEFTEVNGVGQQGLVRFARSGLAPNEDGPRLTSSTFLLRATTSATGEVHLTWTANWDRDNETLTYRLYRSSTSSTPLVERTVTAEFWALPVMGYTDTGLTPGASERYRVTATDAFGNVAMSDWVTVTVAGSGSTGGYLAQVRADEPVAFWRLGDSSGSTLAASIGWDDLTASSGVSLGSSGAIDGDADAAATFDGTSDGFAVGSVGDNGRSSFAVEAWFQTSSADGGMIVGWGNRQNAASNTVNRHLYVDAGGRLSFGITALSFYTLRSPTVVNDGEWHHAVGTYADGEASLYLDGELVASRSDIEMIRQLWGWWHVGGDRMTNWPNRPASDFLAGTVDDVAIYPAPLTAGQVAQHWLLGTTGELPAAVASTVPAAAATDAAVGGTVSAVLSAGVVAGTPELALTGPSGAVVGSSVWDAAARRVTFTPASALAYGSTYSAVVTAAGGMVSGGSWSFTTVTQPAAVVSTTPASGAPAVAVSSTVSAVLSAGAVAGTPELALTGPSGVVVGSSVWDAAARRVTFTPASALAYGSTYSAAVTAGGAAVSGGSWSFTTAADLSATQRYIVHVYRDLFHRYPDAGGLATWTTALQSGTPRVAVANSITGSTEYRSRLIRGIYWKYLGRSAEPAGLEYWLEQMRQGRTTTDLEVGFLASAEYYAQAGGTDATWVQRLYRHVLGRSASSSEVQYWTARIPSLGRASVARGFVLSSEYLTGVVDGYYVDLLGRHIDPAGRQTWVTAIQRGSRLEEIIGSIVASEEYYNKS
ncbi:DUF4214 domain-containing protein [Actinotalea sp. M2MS4P-6]|uniref:DUF4214 domain-containing protein n=1 Tax=Actinotalea sp. M2MS4P-6 TaxID=2983762 RepID=UPI0021E46A12|nr:DUF4214 domain-containing protein [Actinotalea sp. M2MS4P-6]MCV2395206.1 DUF4214 domain-containing protein [Actinotalea sp. M2MS4P-6]